MRLTKQTSHAIRILIDCARVVDRPIKVAEIAQRLDITQQNVFKIVHVLSRAGFVKAARGRNGGVRLARAADDIRIGDVVRATEVTHIEVENGAAGSKRSGIQSLPINTVLDVALEAFITVLDQHTVAGMARSATATEATDVASKLKVSKRQSTPRTVPVRRASPARISD